VGHRNEAAGCTEVSTSEVSAPVETKPRKLLVVAPTMVCVTLPLPSVAVSVTSPAAKRPEMSLPKKLPPAACTPLVKPANVMLSVAVLVDSQGLAVVPAPKNDVVVTEAV